MNHNLNSLAQYILNTNHMVVFCDGTQFTYHKGDDKCECKPITLGAIFIQGIATSIDALSVGFTIATYDIFMALICALIIAVITFVICLLGVVIGKKFGSVLSNKASIFGGIILILIGLEIFITSFF